MIRRLVALFAFLGGFLSTVAMGQAPPFSRWDQSKAVEIVKGVIACEEKGDHPWDRIPWHTEPGDAVAIAQKEQKPLFLFFFLKKNTGPAQAPC